MSLVILMPVNTGRREGFRLSADGCPLGGIPERGRRQTVRHQTYFIPDSKRVQAPSAPGFYRSCASHRTMGSARRAGWFRGEL